MPLNVGVGLLSRLGIRLGIRALLGVLKGLSGEATCLSLLEKEFVASSGACS